MTALLSQVFGQATAVETLRRALAQDRVHHAYLFDGPEGVGKERAALGLAQALVCETRHGAERSSAAKGKACGTCSPCRRVPLRPGEKRPVHPDVTFLERGLYEPAQIGRRTPETQDLSVDQIRTLVLARAAFPPHEGRAKVFVIRRAEEFSVAAANALLKTLEEPGANTHFILLSDKPDRLLSTIRSRTQRLRFGFLHEAEIETILVTSGMDSARARTLASLAGGSAGQAFRLADAEVTGAMEAFVRKASDALQAGDLSDALGLAEDSKKTKGDLPALLGAFGLHLAARAKQMAQTGDPRCDIEAHRFALVLAAQRQLDGNASPQLTLEALFSKLRSLA